MRGDFLVDGVHVRGFVVGALGVGGGHGGMRVSVGRWRGREGLANGRGADAEALRGAAAAS